MERTKAIFNTVFSLCPSIISLCYTTNILPKFLRHPYKITYFSVGSGIADAAVLTDRINREKASLKAFQETTSKIWPTFEHMHTWIFTTHSAYSTERFFIQPQKLSEDVLKTY